MDRIFDKIRVLCVLASIPLFLFVFPASAKVIDIGVLTPEERDLLNGARERERERRYDELDNKRDRGEDLSDEERGYVDGFEVDHMN